MSWILFPISTGSQFMILVVIRLRKILIIINKEGEEGEKLSSLHFKKIKETILLNL